MRREITPARFSEIGSAGRRCSCAYTPPLLRAAAALHHHTPGRKKEVPAGVQPYGERLYPISNDPRGPVKGQSSRRHCTTSKANITDLKPKVNPSDNQIVTRERETRLPARLFSVPQDPQAGEIPAL